MGKQQSDLDKLYGAVSQQLDIGSIEQFKSKMQTKEDRKKFYDAVSKNGLDLGDYSQYESRLGKQNAVSSRGSKNTASTSTEPSQPSQPNIVSNPFGGQTQEQFLGQQRVQTVRNQLAAEEKQRQKNAADLQKALQRTEKISSLPYSSKTVEEIYRMDARDVVKAERLKEEQARQNYAQTNMSLGDVIVNSANNAKIQLQKNIPQLNILAADVWENIFGKEFAKKYYELEGRDINQIRSQAYKELEDLDAQLRQTGGSVSDNIKYLNGSGLVGNLVDAVFNVGATAVPALATAGGATATSLTGQAVADYNNAKAKAKGVSIEQLYQNGDAELGTPLAIGSVATGLELIGLKGMQKAMLGKLTGSTAKKLAIFGLETNKEGLTEWVQVGLDEANKSLANGDSVEQASENAAKRMFSKEGIDSYLMGTLGSIGAGGVGRIISTVVRKPANQQQATTTLQEIEGLERDINNPNLSPQASQILNNQLNTKVSTIADIIDRDVNEVDVLSDEQNREIEQLNDEKVALSEIFVNPEISETSRQTAENRIAEIDSLIESIAPEQIINQNIQQNATTQGNITENNQQQREGTVEQQQGQQENRQNQETVVSQTEEVTSDSNSPVESGQVQEEITSERELNEYGLPKNPIPVDNTISSEINTNLRRNIPENGRLEFKGKNGKTYTIELNDGANGSVDLNSFLNRSNQGVISFAIKDYNNETNPYVGSFSFWHDGNNEWHANNINILKEENKRQGIGSEIYGIIENTVGKLNPSGQQTAEGRAFWNRNNTPVTEEVTIEETVPTPTQERIQEIRDRRQQIYTRIRQKTAINSGINPEILTDLVELGATYIEEGVVRFKDFAQNLRNDFGQEISEQEMRDIYRQSANQLGYNVRGFSESVQANENLSQETRNTVDDLNTLYQTQNYEEIGNRLEQMEESEKVAAVTRLERITSELTPEDNIGVLAGINLIDQYNAAGETAKAQSIIDSLMKSATVAAQTLRQYGEFKRSTPDGFLELIKARLDGKELTPEQEQRIRELFQDVKDYKVTYQQAQDTLLNNINPTNRRARREALVAVEDAQRKLDDYISDIKGSDVYDTLSSVLQGNLLTLKSVIQNPVANALQAGIGGLTNLASIPIDRLLALRTGERSRFGNFNEDNLRNQRYAIQEGIASANRKAVRGSTSTELSKYDTSSRLKPFDAFRRLFIDSFSKSKREAREYNFEQGLSDFLEGTTGQVANFFFRTLPYGDDPFYQLGRQNELNRIAKTKKLTGEEYDRFILQPDSKSEQAADRAGKAQTFQNDNVISRFYNQLVGSSNNIKNRHVKGIVKLVSKTIAPFVKTPSSVALKTVDFAAPIIPFVRSMMNINEVRKLTANGKSTPRATIDRYQSEAAKDMGTALVGTMLGGIATILIKEGLVTGNAPEDKERKKEKDFMYATQPPNTINVSGLRRLLNGESTEYRQGDIVNSYIPLGLAGSVIGITESTMGKDIREKQKQSRFVDTKGQPFYPTKDESYMFDYLGNFISNIPASAQFMMQQSFLQGTSQLLEAMTSGDFGQLESQFAKTFSNIGIPNQVSQAFRAENENLRDVYTTDKWETVVNVLKERYGDIKDLPKKYNMWGDAIKQSPEGTNPYIYQMVDIFRTQPVLKDKLTHQVFNLYKKTSDNSVIPSSVKDFYKQGDFNVKLTDAQLSRLTELVGKERKKLAQKVMLKYNPKESDMRKLDKLAERLATAYSEGARRGKLKFKKELKSGRKI